MPKLIDRTGQRFGRLIALERNGTNTLNKVLWRCRCDCGNELNVVACSLVTGNTVSCGCWLKERITKHGGWNKASYNTWRAMMRRCYKSQDKDYSHYGGKGVTVCERWHNYTNFAADMGEPNGDETLDRINTYGNYEPENCRWAGVTTQNRNVRVRGNSKTGVVGVVIRNNRYYGKVSVNSKGFYSKACKTAKEAAVARKELERLHWGDS
jgi:hypothetical protein